MSNPYGPKATTRHADVPVFPLARLRRLGATPEQMAAMGAAWDAFGLDERRTFAGELALMTDEQVIAVMRGEA